jgi:hypothetical protein
MTNIIQFPDRKPRQVLESVELQLPACTSGDSGFRKAPMLMLRVVLWLLRWGTYFVAFAGIGLANVCKVFTKPLIIGSIAGLALFPRHPVTWSIVAALVTIYVLPLVFAAVCTLLDPSRQAKATPSEDTVDLPQGQTRRRFWLRRALRLTALMLRRSKLRFGRRRQLQLVAKAASANE